MKQLKLNGREILLVEVPEGATGMVLVKSTHVSPPFLYIQSLGKIIDLIPGWYDFLFKDEFYPTEEEAAELIEKITGLEKVKPYPDFEYPESRMWTAIESWNSFLTSHGFTPGKVVGLIEKGQR